MLYARFIRYTAVVFAYVGVYLGVVEGSSVLRNPIRYSTTIERPIIHTSSHRVNSLSTFDLSFSLHQGKQEVKLKLSPNHDAIADNATIKYVASDGVVLRTEAIDRRDHKVYMGDAYIQYVGENEWSKVGWARVMVFQDGLRPVFEGAFQLDGDHHHIQTWQNYKSTKRSLDPDFGSADKDGMIVWRDSDVVSKESLERRREKNDRSCEFDDIPFNRGLSSITRSELNISYIAARQGGRNHISSIGSKAGCPTSKQVARVGVATDCTYTATFPSIEAARENIIAQFNLASAQYEENFNIALSIQNLIISDAACPAFQQSDRPWNVACHPTVTLMNRLNLFSQWRGQNLDVNAFWTLLTTCKTNPAVGLAWLGQACNPNSISIGSQDFASSTNIIVRTSSEWQVIAHEVGHTFGAVHDCNAADCSNGASSSGQCCPLSADTCDAGGQFLMSPTTSQTDKRFSPCSVGNICSAIGQNGVSTACLSANRIVTTTAIGTCGNGIVEAGEECDCGGLEGCGDNPCCDPTTCTAKVENGQSCGKDSSFYCASGQCTNRDLQCTSQPDVSFSMPFTALGNFTGACFPSSCRLSCTSAYRSACFVTPSSVIDGADCGSGGRCFSGVCQGSTPGEDLASGIGLTPGGNPTSEEGSSSEGDSSSEMDSASGGNLSSERDSSSGRNLAPGGNLNSEGGSSFEKDLASGGNLSSKGVSPPGGNSSSERDQTESSNCGSSDGGSDNSSAPSSGWLTNYGKLLIWFLVGIGAAIVLGMCIVLALR